MLNLNSGKSGSKRACFVLGLSLLFLFLLVVSAPAQFTLPGQLPARLSLRQQQSDHFKVVYPEGLVQLPSGLLHSLERAFQLDSPSLVGPFRKIPVWLNSREIRSNGRVVWAPRRIELFSTPPQSQEPGSWIEHLAVHEFRHVVQMERLNRGPIRVLSLLTGQQAVGLAASLLPLWYLEGDAVAAETALFPSARGFLPSFRRVAHTAWLSDHTKPPGYFASMLGSYRVPTPGPYAMGYSMVAAISDSFGARVLADAALFAARRPYLLTPFSNALRRSTGMSAPQWHDAVGSDFRKRWLTPSDSLLTPFLRKNHRSGREYLNFTNPLWVSDSLLIVQQEGIGRLREFLLLDGSGAPKMLLKPSPVGGERISFGGTLLAYTEFLTHPRWQGQSRSVVGLFDVSTRTKLALSHPLPLFSPALSADGSRMVAVETNPDNRHSLVLFSLRGGGEYVRFPAPDNKQIQWPVWYGNEKYIAAVLNDSKGACVAWLDPETGRWETLYDLGFRRIADLASHGFSLFFTGDFGDVTNIYLYQKGWSSYRQITRSRYGAASPMPDPTGRRLLYADYTPLGFDIAEILLDSVPPALPEDTDWVQHQALQLQSTVPFHPVPSVPLSVPRQYRKGTHLFQLHSWAPFYYDYHEMNSSDPELLPGFVLVSQNLTGSLTSMMGMSFHTDPVFHARFTYRGWFPVVEVEVDAGGLQRFSRVPIASVPEVGTRYRFSSRLYVPLLFPSGRGAFQWIPSAEISYSNDLLRLQSGAFHEGVAYMKGSMQAAYFRYASDAHLAPPFGVLARVRWLDSPFLDEGAGTLWAVDSRFWLPGMARLHSTQLTLGWQRQSINSTLFSSEIDFPRGYPEYPSVQLTRFLLEYAFPWAYPDLEVGAFLFVKRLRSAFFGDFARNKSFTFGSLWFKQQHMASLGVDLVADWHLLGLPIPLSTGARMMFLPNESRWGFELIFAADLTGF